MKVTLKNKRTSVSLTKRDFIAAGGEGQVYAKGGVAYKIYIKRSSMIPEAKIEELSHISRPEVNKPDDVVLDSKGRAVGYTYKFIDNATALCQLFTKAFRQRHGITPGMTGDLVLNMQEVLHHIHERGVLVVDLNELNLLVPDGWDKAHWIDVDSYQTKHFPATAIMESIRDWSTSSFSELSDWFSFAVVTFQMFIGVHPYKGKHASIKGMVNRMKAGVSVFNPEVKIPKMCPSMDVIPPELWGWYKRVLEDGRREVPPAITQAVSGIIPRVRMVSSTAKLAITEWRIYNNEPARFLRLGSNDVAMSGSGVWVNKTLNKNLPPSGAVGITPDKGHVVYANCQGTWPKLWDMTSARAIDLDLRVDSCMDYDGRIYFKGGDKIYEVQFLEMPTQVKAAVKVVANVMEKATKLYDGAAVQNMLGACYVSVFAEPGRHYQYHVKQADGWQILDAKHDNRVLMLVGAKGGKYRRWTLILDLQGGYSCEQQADVPPSSPNFTVLPSGICAHINEQEELELFLNRPGSQVKVVADPMLSNDMRLCRSGGDVLFTQGQRVFKISTRG